MIKRHKYLLFTSLLLVLLLVVLLVRNDKTKTTVLFVNYEKLLNNSSLSGNMLTVFNNYDTIYLKKLNTTVSSIKKEELAKQHFTTVDSLIKMFSKNSGYFIDRDSDNENFNIEIIKFSQKGKDSLIRAKPILSLSDDYFYK